MIKIICIGKLKEAYLKEAVDDYIARINKYHKIQIIELPDSNIEEEKEKIFKVVEHEWLQSNANSVVLDLDSYAD